MPAYRRGLAERGRVCPVEVASDGSLLVVSRPHLEKLCLAYLSGDIDEVELSYVATALELTTDFQFVTKELEECAFFLSSPELNGEPLSKVVPAVLRALREHAA
jgi:hypothetical protein